jgi:hypothetical protein
VPTIRTFVSPCGGGSALGVEVAGALVAAGVVLVVTPGLVEAAVVVTAVVVAAVVVPDDVVSGELEATVAINAVDVDATRARGVVVEKGMDEVAST